MVLRVDLCLASYPQKLIYISRTNQTQHACLVWCYKYMLCLYVCSFFLKTYIFVHENTIKIYNMKTFMVCIQIILGHALIHPFFLSEIHLILIKSSFHVHILQHNVEQKHISV